VFIDGLLGQQRRGGLAFEPGHEHVGEEHAAKLGIDEGGERGRSLAHRCPLECLSTAQQFAIDLGNLFEDLANPMIVGYTRADLGVVGLRDVIHLRRSARVTYGQVVLGAVSGTLRALAAGLATALVALDERAAQDRLQGWKFPQ
jgi:hypothetical protein